tara:strand:+ start:496 stop:849 length:354 start_codon:yes stop_codon:yes gene_type:complete
MIDKTSLFVGALFMVAAQASAWLQLNGQFVWQWCKEHPWLMIIVPSVPISFFYLYATKYLVEGFDGALWPTRFLSFGIGILIFAWLAWWLNNEPMNAKTIASLCVAVVLIGIQIIWK